VADCRREAGQGCWPLSGARGRVVPTCAGRVRRGPSPWRAAGRRKATGLPGAAEDWFWGRCERGGFGKALMRGLPAEGTWRKFTRSWRRGSLSSAI